MRNTNIAQIKGKVLSGIAVFLCAVMLAACSSGLAGRLPGTYELGYGQRTFYSDGTYEETGKYGTGQWVILENHTLKLTDFYGETVTFEVSDITNQGVVCADGSIWERVK